MTPRKYLKSGNLDKLMNPEINQTSPYYHKKPGLKLKYTNQEEKGKIKIIEINDDKCNRKICIGVYFSSKNNMQLFYNSCGKELRDILFTNRSYHDGRGFKSLFLDTRNTVYLECSYESKYINELFHNINKFDSLDSNTAEELSLALNLDRTSFNDNCKLVTVENKKLGQA